MESIPSTDWIYLQNKVWYIRFCIKNRMKYCSDIYPYCHIISKADKIIVLDRGKIVEQGTHQMLKSAGGIYQKIYEIQSGNKTENEV